MSTRPEQNDWQSLFTLTMAVLFTLTGLVTSVIACNIPVFRYALERWQPDQCEITVFHQGPLNDKQRLSVEKLNRQISQRDNRATAKLQLVDVSEFSIDQQSLWESVQTEQQGHPSLPFLNVRMQLGPGRLVNAWRGPLVDSAIDGVFDSPARRELSRRLLNGHSVVWVVIGSNTPDPSDRIQRNQDVRELLSKGFESLSNSIELPEGIGLPGSELHSEIPLLLKFSLLEIDPNDPRESFLVRLFSQMQPQAFDRGEPLLIPVFGRGRALEVIPASTFNGRLMEDLTIFLSGACSCQVKEQNPGFDLLMSIDWDTELFGEDVAPPPERTTRDREKPVLLTIPPGR